MKVAGVTIIFIKLEHNSMMISEKFLIGENSNRFN